MRIWIDLANSPHVPFFRALITEFRARGHEVVTTARAFAQTIEMAKASGLDPIIVGEGEGGGLARKARNLTDRAIALARWARSCDFDLAVGHNSYAQTIAARIVGVRSVTLMDYEHQPANHLAFRLASRVIVPASFPEDRLRRCGARGRKVRRYNGIKEDVYLADFVPDPGFAATLRELCVAADDVLVVVRPPAREALYHRFENELFDELLTRLCASPGVKTVLLPRTSTQRLRYETRGRAGGVGNMIIPRMALDGANLIASADLIVSAGGTMNREAAALGVPAATIYAGRWAAVDEELMREGKLQRLSTREDLQALRVEKKRSSVARRALHVRAEITKLILE